MDKMIPGLTYHKNLLTEQEQSDILREIDNREWRNDLKRRVQHYGYVYDYKARNVDPSMYLGPLPDFALTVAQKLLENNLIEVLPDQAIVNEYLPGQGISAHIDCEPCFENVIVTVSLGWPYEMGFINRQTKERIDLLLEVGSALAIRGEARYFWYHEIKARKYDNKIPRERRVSLTFRNVRL